MCILDFMYTLWNVRIPQRIFRWKDFIIIIIICLSRRLFGQLSGNNPSTFILLVGPAQISGKYTSSPSYKIWVQYGTGIFYAAIRVWLAVIGRSLLHNRMRYWAMENYSMKEIFPFSYDCMNITRVLMLRTKLINWRNSSSIDCDVFHNLKHMRF